MQVSKLLSDPNQPLIFEKCSFSTLKCAISDLMLSHVSSTYI